MDDVTFCRSGPYGDVWKAEPQPTTRHEDKDKTKLSCLVANSVHTVGTDKTRQDSFVSSVSAVWTSYKYQFCKHSCCSYVIIVTSQTVRLCVVIAPAAEEAAE